MGRALFVTGTGTDVGKTYVAGLMVKTLVQAGKRPGYYKAAMSGNVRREDGSLIPGDAVSVRQVSGVAQPLEEMCPYVYEHAWSPHLAARAEGNPVSLDVVAQGFQLVCSQYDYVTVEGSGGILCPIRFDETRLWLEDVVRALGLASVLVTGSGLGAINSVVLTADYMNARGLPLKGLLFNRYHPGDPVEEDNIRMCSYRTGLPVLAKVRDGSTELEIDAEELCKLYE